MAPIRTYTREQALAHARRALEEGLTVPTVHFKNRMSERSFDMGDVVVVFESGTISDRPTWDDEHRSLECKVEGQDLEGEELSIVFAIDEEGRIHLITGM